MQDVPATTTSQDQPAPAKPQVINVRGRIQSLERSAERKLTAGEYVECQADCQEIFKLDPAHVDAAYMMAVASIRLDRKSECYQWLDKAIDFGFRNPIALASNRDFEHVRRRSEFVRIVGRLEELRRAEEARIAEAFRSEVRGALTSPPSLALDLDVDDLSGGRLSRSSFGGRPALVVLLQPWHDGVDKQIPHLIELHRNSLDKPVAIAGLVYEYEKTEARMTRARHFVSQYEIPFSCGIVDRAWTRSLPGPLIFPTHILFGADGKVRYYRSQVLTLPELDVLIEAALSAS